MACRCLAGAVWPALSGRRCLAGAVWPALSGRRWPALSGRRCLAGAVWPALSGRRCLAASFDSSPWRRRFVTGLAFTPSPAARTIGLAPGSIVLARSRGVSATSLIGGKWDKAKWDGGWTGQRPRVVASVVRLVGVLALFLAVTTTTLAANPLPSPAQTPAVTRSPPVTQSPEVTAGTGTCAENPGQGGCAVTAVSLNPASLGNCSPDCQLNVGTTVEIPIQAVYNDGSAGPLSNMSGGTGPEVAFWTAPAPSGSFTLSGVVNGSGGVTEVQLTADETARPRPWWR